MAQKGILTSDQKKFLQLASEENYIASEFYLSGGTALSAFYLFHRYSEDLDFFIEKEEVNLELVKRFIGKMEK
ncbi:MAG: nucleotidyl transferase AbiEii/AbiGii toxin family protein, partial [Candidatus Omnitrophota bacterium]|nr:nucleotidyl transferase AbiEii/AbiGii toxin family protein [Candidatus Omnitrophota bacterium]